MPKEKKPPLRERIFGPKAQRPSRPPAPVQPAPSGPSAVELSSDSDQKGNAAGTKHRRGLRSIFSRPSKPNTNSVNDADVGETRPAEQDEKLAPWSAAFVQLRKDNSTSGMQRLSRNWPRCCSPCWTSTKERRGGRLPPKEPTSLSPRSAKE